MKTINVRLEPASAASTTSPMAQTDLRSWLVDQVARFTYKPGWRFLIIPTDRNMAAMGAEWALRILVEVEDTYHPGTKIDVVSHYPIWYGEYLNEERFIKLVARHIQQFEIHESREWFRVDGEIYDDPHRED